MKKIFILTALCTLFGTWGMVAHAKYYGIQVGGVEVTDINASNVTGSNIKAKVSSRPYSVVYDASTNTLTLDNIKIERTGSYNRAILNESCDGLTVIFKSACSLDAEDSSPVRLNANTTLKSVDFCCVDIHGGNEDGLTIGNGATLTIDRAYIRIACSDSDGLCGNTGNEKVIVKNNAIVSTSGGYHGMDNTGIDNIASLYVENAFFHTDRANKLKAFTLSENMYSHRNYYNAQKQGFGSNGTSDGGAVPCVYINEETFPDDSLRAYILNTDYNYLKKGVLIHTCPVEGIGYLVQIGNSTTKGALTELKLSYTKIRNLKGIEHFENLAKLNCAGLGLTTLDVTPFQHLEYLKCDENEISSLDLRKNPQLKTLFCNDNKLTTLNMSQPTAVTTIKCNNNNLTTLNLSNQTALSTLDCSNNNLTTLNLSNQAALSTLDCSNNNLTALSLPNSATLISLNCSNNNLTALNMANATALKEFYCNNNNLSTLNLSKQTQLIRLDCSSNQLTSLTLGFKSSLVVLYCSTNKLTQLDLAGYNYINCLDCSVNRLTSLTLSCPTSLERLICAENSLTQLDLTDYVTLEYLDCNRNKLTSLNIGGCKKLVELRCGNNKLTELNTTDNTSLQVLQCQNNSISTLDLAKNQQLLDIDASCNKLQTLNLLWCTKLEQSIKISGNNINGEGLDNLIANLPAKHLSIRLVDHEYADEQNECTAAQVTAASNKGWTVQHNLYGWKTTTECALYDLWIKGLHVHNHGPVVTGTSYDAATNTLTLNNANITYDGMVALGTKIDNLNVKLTGKNVINAPGVGLRFETKTGNSKVTFSGGGELNVTTGGHALFTFADVEFKDGVKVSAECTDVYNGMIGRKFSADGNFPTIIMSGEGTEVKAKGGKQGSVWNFHALNFSDGITIAEPTGATYAEDYGVVKDNKIVAGEWVVFKKGSFNPADVNRDGTVDSADIVAVIKEMPDGDMKADVNGDKAIDSADIVAVIKAMK